MNKRINDLTGFNLNFKGRFLPSNKKKENNIIMSLKWVANSPPTFLQETINFKTIAFSSSSCVVHSIKEQYFVH